MKGQVSLRGLSFFFVLLYCNQFKVSEVLESQHCLLLDLDVFSDAHEERQERG